MKILQINCVFGQGSTGRLAASLHESLRAQGVESVVCYGRGTAQKAPGIYKTSSEWEAKAHALFSRLFSVDFGYSPLATRRLIRLIQREKPDIVHLHCLNGHFVNLYRLLDFLKAGSYKTVLTLHAEIMHTAGCEHAGDCEKWRSECSRCPKVEGKLSRFFRDDARHCYRKMQRAVHGFDTLTAVGVSSWLTERAAASPIFRNIRCVTIHNGVNTRCFHYIDPKPLRERLQLKNQKVLLHVTPDFRHPIKGGQYIVSLAEKMPEAVFLIIGGGTEGMSLPENLRPVGYVGSPDELAAYYSLADVTLLTSRRETFSMVCAESLCCGTPVAGFFAGGPETIALPGASAFVPFGDVDGLERISGELLGREWDKPALSREAGAAYADSSMAEQYLSLYKEMLGE